jgi:hypothetical protein
MTLKQILATFDETEELIQRIMLEVEEGNDGISNTMPEV